jgi:hypothetical protein
MTVKKVGPCSFFVVLSSVVCEATGAISEAVRKFVCRLCQTSSGNIVTGRTGVLRAPIVKYSSPRLEIMLIFDINIPYILFLFKSTISFSRIQGRHT